MKKICMIATGGTIASEAGKNGLRPALTGEKLLHLVPQLENLASIDCREILQLDSSNLLPEHWQLMARTVAEAYEEYDGFVITHGTDTMAYSAAALYYMLKNIHKPVVFTGSQLPIEHPATDAKRNLFAAFQAAASGRGGVYLAFDTHVIWGNAVKKMYTEEFEAFLSINREDAAYFDGRRLVWNEAPAISEGFVLQDKLDERVGVLKLIPGMEPVLLQHMADFGYHAIILEGYGAGGVPTEASAKNFLPAIDYAAEKGCLIVCATQCIYNGVHLDRYEMGVLAARHGAISGGDLPFEALTARLMVLLAQTRDPAEVRRIIEA